MFKMKLVGQSDVQRIHRVNSLQLPIAISQT